MIDTSIEIDEYMHKLSKSKSGEERLIMGCSMFDFSKEIVKSSIKNKNSDINDKDLKIELFNRFYGADFSPRNRQKIQTHLRKKSKD